METERQVEEHLTGHIDECRTPTQSRAIVTMMRDDESRHGAMAQEAGALELPLPRELMRVAASVMKAIAYRI